MNPKAHRIQNVLPAESELIQILVREAGQLALFSNC